MSASFPVSADAVSHFVDQGFLVVPDLVSPAELATIKADTIALARGAYPCPSLKPVPAGLTDQQVSESVLCIHQPHYVSPVMDGFARHERICQTLGRLVGAHLPHWDGAVKCMQTMLFVKSPGKPGQAWHQDERYIPTRDRSLCGAWIAVDDATIDNGCLWVVPGSHRDGYIFPWKNPEDLDECDGSSQCVGFDESKAVPVEVKAGSVVFFNGYLLHKSLKNRSSGYRRALVSHYMNAWSLLPWGMEQQIADNMRNATGTNDSTPVADNRKVFIVHGTDPYAWKGSVPGDQDVYLRTFGKTWKADEANAAKQGVAT